jgi:hypothetical protein
MRLLFGAVIAIVLLGLYAYSVFTATAVVNCVETTGCAKLTLADFTDGMASTMTLIGGLVSALVIVELSVTQPGEPPVARALADNPTAKATMAVKVLTSLYLLAWIVTGLWALIVGVMQHPKVLQPLTDLGQAWLGLAVAAAYAYFGVKPK